MYQSITDTPFFQHILLPKDVSAVKSAAQLQLYEKGSALYFEGDKGKEMFLVKSGSLKIFRQHSGQEIILGHQFPGEAIGELETFHYHNQRTASVAALEPTEVWMLPGDFMQELAEKYPAFYKKTIYILSERLAQTNRLLEYVTFLDVRMRVANLLLDLHTNFGESTEEGEMIRWKITHQHAANMIGSSREALSRAFHSLQQEKLIRLEKRFIYILDLEKLTALSESSEKSGVYQNREWHSSYKYDF